MALSLATVVNLLYLVLILKRRPYVSFIRRVWLVPQPVDVLNALDAVLAALLVIIGVVLLIMGAIPSARKLAYPAGLALSVLGMGYVVIQSGYVILGDRKRGVETADMTATGPALTRCCPNFNVSTPVLVSRTKDKLTIECV